MNAGIRTYKRQGGRRDGFLLSCVYEIFEQQNCRFGSETLAIYGVSNATQLVMLVMGVGGLKNLQH
jgi:hypothetical protein